MSIHSIQFKTAQAAPSGTAPARVTVTGTTTTTKDKAVE